MMGIKGESSPGVRNSKTDPPTTSRVSLSFKQVRRDSETRKRKERRSGKKNRKVTERKGERGREGGELEEGKRELAEKGKREKVHGINENRF